MARIIGIFINKNRDLRVGGEKSDFACRHGEYAVECSKKIKNRWLSLWVRKRTGRAVFAAWVGQADEGKRESQCTGRKINALSPRLFEKSRLSLPKSIDGALYC